MNYVAPNVLIRRNSADHVGGVYSLRLAYSADIITQRFQTDSEIIPPLKFLNDENWVTGWEGQFLQAQLVIEEFQSEDGITEEYQFQAFLDSFCTERIFRAWWTKYLKGRSFCAELTDMNGFLRILNPFRITYKYFGTREYSETNRYELIFKRAKINDYESVFSVCKPTLLSITELKFEVCKPTLLSVTELDFDDDWEDVETKGEDDWEDIETNCKPTLLSITELTNEDDWEDIETNNENDWENVESDTEKDWENTETTNNSSHRAFDKGFDKGFS